MLLIRTTAYAMALHQGASHDHPDSWFREVLCHLSALAHIVRPHVVSAHYAGPAIFVIASAPLPLCAALIAGDDTFGVHLGNLNAYGLLHEL